MPDNMSTIKIFADDEEDEVVIKGALPSVREIGARVHNVSGEVVQRNLANLMQQVESMFNSSIAAVSTLAIKEVKVAVAVTASGDVSLLGLAKASAEMEATFEITFVP